MNIFEIESEREKISNLIYSHKTPRLLLHHISIYFEKILEADQFTLTEAYLREFLPNYKIMMRDFEVEGINPAISQRIISSAETLNEKLQDDELEASLSILKNNFHDLKNILEGNNLKETRQGLSFPVLENKSLMDNAIGGIEYIEITIRIRNDLGEDEFILVPTHLNVDGRMEKQIIDSWQIALNSSKKYIRKVSAHHEIIIKFKKRFGYYEGNSLGVALALIFLKEILKFYNSRYLILPDSGISATGSLDKNRKLRSLGVDIIKNKTEVVFYSTTKKFLVPKEDEHAAIQKLAALKEIYPNKKLSIIGIESLDDILDRRNLIRIKKENRAVWTYKKLAGNKFTAGIVLLSFLIVAYFLFWQFDDSPAHLEFQPSTLLLKNEAGNLLWKKRVGAEPTNYLNSKGIKRTKARITNLNNDDSKEILVVQEPGREDSLGGIACYDEKGKELWYYYFRESVETPKDKFSSLYDLGKIIDIYEENGEKEILIAGQHINFYPTPFVKINPSGERVKDVFWHPGGTRGGFLEDIDDDGKIELVASAISNGIERCVLFSIEYDKLKGTAPTTENYRFLEMEIADFDHYVLLPKSDYNRAKNYRYNSPFPPSINNGKISVNLDEDRENFYRIEGFAVRFEKDFSNPRVIVDDDFRTLRDSLVVKGKINPPFTDTPEYAEILRDQIRYWNGEEFVEHNEYFSK